MARSVYPARAVHPGGSHGLCQAGALLLILLTACASTTRYLPHGLPPDYTPDTRWYEVDDIESGSGAMCPVPMDKSEFQRALRQLARDVRWDAPPQDAARALLEAGLEEEWVAEVSRGRVLTLVPLHDKGPLAPRRKRH